MSTPIENNTEELQNILQTVNNLPNLGGSGFSIPVIDLIDLGFPYLTDLSYNESVEISQAVYNEIKTKLEFGFVRLHFMFMATPLTMGFCTGIWPDLNMPLYNATAIDYAGNRYVFNLSYDTNANQYMAALYLQT